MGTHYVAGLLFGDEPAKSVFHPIVALIKKERPEWQKGLWNGIGGHIEPEETPLDAMIREFKEEAGLEIKDWVHFCTLVGKDWAVDWFVSGPAEELPEIKSVTDEEVYWWPIDMLPPTIPNVAWLINMAYYDNPKNWPYTVIEGLQDY